jgi:PII-like signaling protein
MTNQRLLEPHQMCGTCSATRTSDGAWLLEESRAMSEHEIRGRGIRVRAYFGERDRHDGQMLWRALLEFLRTSGASGATVNRGVAGYGAHSKIHAASILDLSADLPLVLEWIDSEDRVNELLPRLEELLQGGMITTDPVQIVRYQPHTDRGQ